jgi:CDP-paratose 2-epimerase
MSRTLLSLAGFQVIISGRFWVIAEGSYPKNPRSGEVYNMRGARHSNCSMLEAIRLCEESTGQSLTLNYVDQNRRGDPIWWISDLSHFQEHYFEWKMEFDVPRILHEIFELNRERWDSSRAA